MLPGEVIGAAFAMRDELDALVGDDAGALRDELDDLLGSPLEEDELAEAIRRLLGRHDATREWLRRQEEPAVAGWPPPAHEAAPPPTSAEPPAPPAMAEPPAHPTSAAPPPLEEAAAEDAAEYAAEDAAEYAAEDAAEEGLLGSEPVAANGGGGARTAYTRLDAPGEVAVGVAFDVVVGLRADPDPAVFGAPVSLPPQPVVVGVHVTADGIDLAPGSSWRHELRVVPGEDLPSVPVRLVAQPQPEPVREARIQVLFTVAGQAIGFGSRAVLVTADASLMTGRAPEQPEPGTAAPLPVRTASPDLTIWLRRGKAQGDLLWSFETPTNVPVPDAPLETSIGTDANTFAKALIMRVNGLEGKPNLYPFLRGVGRAIADRMPLEAFALLSDVAERIGRRPRVQLLTEEAYVPWELAWLDDPLDDDLPPYLGAQAMVGRWITGVRRPQAPPPDVATGTVMAVVSGVYDKVPGWNRLVAAEEEAAELAARYGAAPVDATLQPVLSALGGDPRADVLHFAVHGNYDQGGGMDGLVLVDRELVDPFVVEGMTLEGGPFVFLNACQVGMGQAILGDYAGLAAAFLKAGACAVVAPLWSVKDSIAKELALDFYERVRNGEAPAEVLRSERAQAEQSRTPPSATAFAYQYFGHPALTLVEEDA